MPLVFSFIRLNRRFFPFNSGKDCADNPLFCGFSCFVGGICPVFADTCPQSSADLHPEFARECVTNAGPTPFSMLIGSGRSAIFVTHFGTFFNFGTVCQLLSEEGLSIFGFNGGRNIYQYFVVLYTYLFYMLRRGPWQTSTFGPLPVVVYILFGL